MRLRVRSVLLQQTFLKYLKKQIRVVISGVNSKNLLQELCLIRLKSKKSLISGFSSQTQPEVQPTIASIMNEIKEIDIFQEPSSSTGNTASY